MIIVSLSIEITPFEALYGRGGVSLIRWFEGGDMKHLGVELVRMLNVSEECSN